MEKSQLGIGSKINHPKFGLGVICNLNSEYYKIYFTSTDDLKEISRDFTNFEIVEKITADVPPLGLEDIEKAVEKVMRQFKGSRKTISIGSKWLGGTIELKPGSDDLQSKEVPIDTFFSKIISVREKLRVLEQNINNHESLNDAEKIHLQQYITRAYGSLTTFNVLFANKEDHFKGMGKS